MRKTAFLPSDNGRQPEGTGGDPGMAGDIQSGPVLRCLGISAGYRGRQLFAPADLEVYRGECILLCGANGSGKSTLLKALAGIRPLISGEVTHRGTNGNIPMIPSGIPKVRGFTLMEFIRTGCYSSSDWAGRLSPEKELAAAKAAGALGLSGLADRDISSLSDGEFQKGCIAAALARNSGLVLLDEPTAFLDAENRISVLETLKDTASREGTAFIFSSHDLADASAVCSRVFAIGSDGILRCSGESMEEKNRVISSIFRNKSIIFER